MSETHGSYYLPKPTHWPIIGSFALFFLLGGLANFLHGHWVGPYMMGLGFILFLTLLFGWFSTVIKENRAGLLSSPQVEHSFRWGMVWFIFTEVMFFATFFGALFYARLVSVPQLAGEGSGWWTHILLWPAFQHTWPVYTNPNPEIFQGPKSVMETWGIPAINTGLLLSSGATITVVHWAILKQNYFLQKLFQVFTILLGLAFLCMQINEYSIAYMEKGLTLGSGIFGTTFFILTGFHMFHVTVGTIMLIVILWRLFKKDFGPGNLFGFEAVSWYWHFVDVVWLFLFVFVYWI